MNADGTLKDADEMDWPDSPTEAVTQLPPKRIRRAEDASNDDSDSNVTRSKRSRVTVRSQSSNIATDDDDMGEQDDEDQDAQQDGGATAAEGSDGGHESNAESQGDDGSESEEDNNEGTKRFWAAAAVKGGDTKVRRHGLLFSTYISLTCAAQEEEPCDS